MVGRKAGHRGIAGYIIDGLIRDLPALLELDMPVYAKGVTPIGPLHRGPGEVNFPISCGGIVVNPGDLICADMSGVVVVHANFAENVLQRLANQRESLAAYNASIDRGDFSNEWVDRMLNQAGCVFED
jgi:regulator of RNase E activity RraA